MCTVGVLNLSIHNTPRTVQCNGEFDKIRSFPVSCRQTLSMTPMASKGEHCSSRGQNKYSVYLVTSSALMASQVFLASPRSISVLLLKNTGLSTPAYPDAIDLFMKIVCFARHT